MEQKLIEPKLPNFFIIGAAKAGTTSVYEYLSQHPEIYLSPNKEPQFFSIGEDKFPHKGPGDSKYDRRLIKRWEDYIDLFKGVKNEKVLGEASTTYIYFNKTAAASIFKFNPSAKILIILRNPAERAFSAYKHLLREKRETLSFENAIEAEKERMRKNYVYLWFYKDLGYYHYQVQEYLNTFGSDSVKICLSEDLNKNPQNVIKDVFKFLDVDDCFTPDISIKHNTTKLSVFSPLNNILNNDNHPVKKFLRPVFFNTIGEETTGKLVNYAKAKTNLRMNPETRKYLTDLYREDVLKLQDLIDRDLSAWL